LERQKDLFEQKPKKGAKKAQAANDLQQEEVEKL